jgi:hypothetical protein
MSSIKEIREACRVAKNNANGIASCGEGWTVKAVREYNTPRGGPMAAWKWLYYLVRGEKEQFGGYDRMDSFASWASDFIWKAGI